MTYEPTPDDVERALRTWLNTSGNGREISAAILLDHHRALAERGVFVAEWRPIETARRDGRRVLGWGSVMGDEIFPIKFSLQRMQDGAWTADSGEVVENPTRWMRLPPEPKP